MTAKVPRTPPAGLSIEEADLTEYRGPLWRICRTTGPHARPWNAGRTFGPLAGMRWEPHDPPARSQPARAVLYAATDIATAVAEVWQVTRRIDADLGRPILVRATPTRALRLLDLTDASTWPLRQGASASLPHAGRGTCRAWSRGILDASPDLDGLYVPSTKIGRNVVLFPAGIAALPSSPDMSIPADDPAAKALLEVIASRIGYRV